MATQTTIRVYASLVQGAFKAVDSASVEVVKPVSGQIVRDNIVSGMDPNLLVGGGVSAPVEDVKLVVGDRWFWRTPATGGPAIVVKPSTGAKLAYLVRSDG